MIISFLFAQRAKKASAEGRSPPQELEVGPRSRPYLLVVLKEEKILFFPVFMCVFYVLFDQNIIFIYSKFVNNLFLLYKCRCRNTFFYFNILFCCSYPSLKHSGQDKNNQPFKISMQMKMQILGCSQRYADLPQKTVPAEPGLKQT